jgi:hypothetical protein
MDVTDEYINKLFIGTNFGESINNSVDEKNRLIYKTLIDLKHGYWSGHTSYHIVLNGGFIHDGKKCEPKKLTAFGDFFMSQYQ